MKNLEKTRSAGIALLRVCIFFALFNLFSGPLVSQIVYVTPYGAGSMDGTSWANALPGNNPGTSGYTRLADTLRHAVSGTAFWVAEGTYLPATDNDRNKSFEIVQNIAVYGGFGGSDTTFGQRNYSSHETIFSGNIGNSADSIDNTKIILKTVSAPWTLYSNLDGLTIKNSYNNSANTISPGLVNYACLNVSHCTFKNNYSNGSGGGIYNSGKINIRNCLFFNNRASSGGGVYNEYLSGPTSTAFLFATSCRFSNNSAGHNGGAICNSGAGTISNCLVVNNVAGLNGGGIYSGGNVNTTYINTKIINSTFSSNSINLYFFRGAAVLWNSISWGGSIYISSYTNPDIKYSCIQGSISGTGVLNTEPLFINPTLVAGTSVNGLNGDWHIRWCSPCFNAASNLLVLPADTTDLDGLQRIRYSYVDMGCYELDTTSLYPNSINYSGGVVYVDTGSIFKGDGSSWIQALGGKVESCKYPGRSMLYEAMADAPPGTQIWVSAGTYLASTWNIRDHAFTVAPGVKVYGGFFGTETSLNQRNASVNKTILSGNIGNSALDTDNSYHVLYINPGSIVYLDSAWMDGITIEKGYADGVSPNSEGAGMLINTNTKIRCRNIDFVNNTAKGNGGGIKINTQAKVTLDSCRVETNHLVLSYNGSYYNSASGCGIYNQGKVSVFNTLIKFNDNGKEGSGIYNADSLVLIDCAIDSNTATFVRDSYGVGLSNSGYCKSINTSIRFNKANLNGGGIQNKAGATMILDSNIVSSNFTLVTGGGIFNDGYLTLNGCDIQNNSTLCDGGGLTNSGSANCNITGSTIAYNTASGGTMTTGGGGICNSGYLSVVRSKICNNQTSGNGGGMYNPTLVKHCLIANNTRGGQYKIGGGLYLGSGFQGIFNSTIANNATEGISTGNDTIYIYNSIIWGNDTQLSGRFKLWYACVENGNSVPTVIRDNPEFTSPTTGKGIGYNALFSNWAPVGCSPVVNLGNNNFLNAGDTLDIESHPRVFETNVDLGAYEFQQIQPHSVDFSSNKVFVCDSATAAGKGTSWDVALSGNAPSCRYPGYNLLYEAMRDAPSSCPIWIKKGVYYTSADNDRNKYFLLKSGLQVFGGFAGNEQWLVQRNPALNPTILSGNVGNPLDSTDNAFHVLYTYPADSLVVDTIILDGLTITSGYANYQCQYNCLHDDLVGGGLFLNSNHFLKMNNCIVTENYGIGNFSNSPSTIGKMGGGGIYNKGSLWLKNCLVKKNTNLRMGGGIFNDLFLNLYRCKIDSNTISQSAGSGYSAWGGAGVYNTPNGSLVFDSCAFTGNRLINTQLSGGGIRNRGQMGSVINSSFRFNANSGVATENPIWVTNCEFISNDHGVQASQSVHVENCLFKLNGIGVSTGGNSQINDCEFSYNGYAISSGGKTRISNCQIHHNDNGGFFVSGSGGLFQIITVIANRNGAGINHTGDSLWVENCNIHHNISGGGAGITLTSGNGFVDRCLITKNVGDAGAAIKNYANLTVRNTLISNNSAHINGVVCNVLNSRTVFQSCTFSNNAVNTGFSSISFRHGTHYNSPGNSHFLFQNCIIQSEFSPLFGCYTGNTGTDSVKYSLSTVPIPGAGNITGNPVFVSQVPISDTLITPRAENYTLSACSPCINAGADSLTTDSLDLAGNPRKYHTIDMGALELKYDSSVTALWVNNIAETSAAIHWQRGVKPCETVVFIKDTVAGSPVPLPGAVYNADTVYGNGTNLAGWFCLSRGLDSITGVTGLLPGTTYRVAVFNRILDTIYDVPALMNFTTPGTIAPVKIVNSDTIHAGESECFNAGIELLVGGSGTPFRINNGGTVELISGQKIRLLPGTTVEPGGYLHAYIAPNGPWCYQTKSSTPLNTSPLTLNTNFHVKAFPNPVSDQLRVTWNTPGESRLLLINTFGSLIYQNTFFDCNQVALSMRNLPPGVYLLHILQGSDNRILKIIHP